MDQSLSAVGPMGEDGVRFKAAIAAGVQKVDGKLV